MDDLTREFLLESQEGLDRMDRSFTLLETRPGDTDLLADIFRAVHTIKGATGFLGFARLEALSHAGENLLGLLRANKLAVTPEIVSGLLALMDRLRAILHLIEETGKEGEVQLEDGQMIRRLEAFHQVTAKVDTPRKQAAIVAQVAAQSVCQSRSGRKRVGSTHSKPATSKSATSSVDAPVAEPGNDLLPEVPLNPSEPEATKSTDAAAGSTSGASDSTLRVDVELLNRMMNLVGELVLTRNQILATNTDAGFALLNHRLDLVTTDLREAVMKARMQPVSHVFSRFPRLVRDLALGLKKHVRLELEGQDTELDKSLIEAIRDPLAHAIRNAIDHGIELPDVRVAGGKQPEGLVRLRARHEGSYVFVEVEDDGAGMNIDKIRAKAIEQKILPQGKVARMDDREILQLAFIPGLSTASSVSNVSGRGVGMDVVRTNVEAIGGKVELESEPGRGAVVRLRIPLTLAIVPVLIVQSGDQNFAVPQAVLTELVHLTEGKTDRRIQWLEHAAFYRFRGKLLPLVFLDELLQQKVRQRHVPCNIVILNADGHRFGLVVDSLAHSEEIVVKPLAGVLHEIGFYSGVTTLGNGDMALIINPGAIAKHAGIKFSNETPHHVGHSKDEDTKNFLLVDAGGQPAALPLETVVRIERIPRSRIERVGSRPALRVDGVLLPLDDAASQLAESPSAVDAAATIVVCRDGERHMGVTVSQVLELMGGRKLEEAGSRAVAEGITLLQERVTEIFPPSRIPSMAVAAPRAVEYESSKSRLPVEPALAEMREVCLVRVGDKHFGVLIAHLVEILDRPAIHPVPLSPNFIGGVVHYRGEVLTVVSLRTLLEMEPALASEFVLVLESPGGPFGISVDVIGETLHMTKTDQVPQSSTMEPRHQDLFAGEWTLNDRRLVCLEPERFDPIRLIRTFQA